MYHYAGNNPIHYIDPDGNAWYSFFFKAVVWLGVNIFGEKSTKALYNDSLSGKLPDQIVSTPQNDMYSLSSGMSSEINNIHINNEGEYDGRTLINSISDNLNDLAKSPNNSLSARVNGKGKTPFGSDMELAIGGCQVFWNVGLTEGDSISVDITINDTFDFDKKASGKRSKSGELLTTIGRLADMKSSEISIQLTITFKKNENGEYEYAK